MRAAKAPWNARAPKSIAWSWASPPRAEAMAKPSNPTTNALRRPTKSAMRPPRSSRVPKASVYALITHWRLASEMESACCADGSATVTTVASRTIMSCASATTPSTHHRRTPSPAPEAMSRPVAPAAGPSAAAPSVPPGADGPTTVVSRIADTSFPGPIGPRPVGRASWSRLELDVGAPSSPARTARSRYNRNRGSASKETIRNSRSGCQPCRPGSPTRPRPPVRRAVPCGPTR